MIRVWPTVQLGLPRMRDQIQVTDCGVNISPRLGEITSSPSIRLTGTVIGIAGAIIGGMVIDATFLTARGLSSTSDFIQSGRMGTRTITTATITIPIRTVTLRAPTVLTSTKGK